MTADRDFKQLVRARMAQTGQNYTAARADLLVERTEHGRAAETEHRRVVARFLVDYGYLERSNGVYRLPQQPPHRHPQYAQELPQWEAFWLPEYLSRTDD